MGSKNGTSEFLHVKQMLWPVYMSSHVALVWQGASFIRISVGWLCGKNMSTSKVDQRYRIVIDKHTRAKTHIKAGDIVIIEPLDDRSFKVKAMDFRFEKVEDDPGWQAFHPPAKSNKHIPPEKLEKLIEETTWLE